MKSILTLMIILTSIICTAQNKKTSKFNVPVTVDELSEPGNVLVRNVHEGVTIFKTHVKSDEYKLSAYNRKKQLIFTINVDEGNNNKILSFKEQRQQFPAELELTEKLVKVFYRDIQGNRKSIAFTRGEIL
ncbi:hypothetical protein [Flammeovirga sp. SubArs3]|uniref:hypothetical protein n=1 Tax=Flammeovirga sp. SubArs3 TaxID=2995316 RepID=UPI00248A96B5|nr:hypothetical protein [Flammeovirga sp. SubArs3]